MFVDVENPAVHALYAKALSETGDHTRAVFELESGLLLNPEPPQAATLHAALAKEHVALHDRAKAKAEQAEALRLDPNSKDAKALVIP
jgi:predicted Zn-dependent protease